MKTLQLLPHSALSERILDTFPSGAYALSGLLRLMDIVETTTVPTAAVECRAQPRMLINPEFVAQHAATPEKLLMLVMHELHHILLGHTTLFPRLTPEQNFVFDAVINGMLCRMFPGPEYTAFFTDFYPASSFPHCLLRPPPHWPDKPDSNSEVPTWPGITKAQATRISEVHDALYSDAGASYKEVFDLLPALLSGQSQALDGVPLLGGHGADDAAGQPRVMNNFTSIGFHVPYVNEKNGKRVSTPLDGALAAVYLTSLGFSKRVVTYVVTASADDIHWLNAITARKLGIAMTFTTPDQDYQARADFSAALDEQLKPQSDPNVVAKLYRNAAHMGFAGAQNNLGDKYETGLGVPKDPKMALYWYTRSAERGEPTAYLSLATMLSESSQDPETLVEAAKFAELARINLPDGKNKNKAEGLVTALTQRLSESDRYRVVILVKRWIPLYQEDHIMGDAPH